jgi:hypothetical protein
MAIDLILLVIRFVREIQFDEIYNFLFEFQYQGQLYHLILLAGNYQFHHEQ